MGITNSEAGTRIDEIAEGVYRISTPVSPAVVPGGFSFNQFLLADEEPLLFHTGPRMIFPLVREALATVLSPERLRWVAFSHWEPDESGALNAWLTAAPDATVLQGQVGMAVCVNDQALRPGRALADGERFSIGKKQLTWLDTPHLPHGWDCGFLFESTTRTLLAGDLFTQGGHQLPPLVESDLLGPSEAFRKMMDYASHSPSTEALMDKLARTEPTTLACMHGSAWHGDGAQALRALGRALA